MSRTGNPFAEDYIDDVMLSMAAGENIPWSRYGGYVNKFGRTTNADAAIETDIWDGANATNDVDNWPALDTARIHDIASTSANDDPAQNGAWTIRIYGLTSWDSVEVSEDITMDGTNNVATSNSYIIIHRMRVLTQGSATTTGPNVGTITATARTDGTVTAYILPTLGQTQMAIYGFPSTQTLYMINYYVSLLKQNLAATEVTGDVLMKFCPNPDDGVTAYIVKHTDAVRSNGTSFIDQPFKPYKKFPGPGIIKLRITSSVNNLAYSGGFNGILINNS